ncbi:MAG: hypothetical protein AB7G25_07345 [Sphingomonadaceae bacterium]
MRHWLYMLGGLIIWAIHFFALYIVVSILLTSPAARVVTLIVTLLCLAADGLLAVGAWRGFKAAASDETARWVFGFALLGIAISAVAVFWQGFPILLV